MDFAYRFTITLSCQSTWNCSKRVSLSCSHLAAFLVTYNHSSCTEQNISSTEATFQTIQLFHIHLEAYIVPLITSVSLLFSTHILTAEKTESSPTQPHILEHSETLLTRNLELKGTPNTPNSKNPLVPTSFPTNNHSTTNRTNQVTFSHPQLINHILNHVLGSAFPNLHPTSQNWQL